MLKVFSKEKFLQDFDNQEFYLAFILSQYGENNWVNWCNGKNADEIRQMGYSIVEEAMVDDTKC